MSIKINDKDKSWSYRQSKRKLVYTGVPEHEASGVSPGPSDSTDYFKISASQGFNVSALGGVLWEGVIEYSRDKVSWVEWDGSYIEGKILYFRGSGNTIICDSLGNGRWVLGGYNVSLSGDVETLLDYQTVLQGEHPQMSDYCFSYMFSNNSTSLTSISGLKLSAESLTEGCYSHMFNGCESLSTIPSDLLSAVSLADNCYEYMFSNCQSLVSLPSNLLPATELANSCYSRMFAGCSGLVSLPADLLPATTLADYCYASMFEYCTSLETLPSNLLPATTLAANCYAFMFDNCQSLTSIPSGFLPATSLAEYCYADMFQVCSSLTLLPSNLLPATTLSVGCYSNMFYMCSNLVSLPLLSATILVQGCYEKMFWQCASVSISETQTTGYSNEYRVPSTGTGTDATNALTEMFTNTGGTFTGTPTINTTYYTSNTVV